MNLDKHQSTWQQYKVINGLEGIPEAEILRAIEQPVMANFGQHFGTKACLSALLLIWCQSC